MQTTTDTDTSLLRICSFIHSFISFHGWLVANLCDISKQWKAAGAQPLITWWLACISPSVRFRAAADGTAVEAGESRFFVATCWTQQQQQRNRRKILRQKCNISNEFRSKEGFGLKADSGVMIISRVFPGPGASLPSGRHRWRDKHWGHRRTGRPSGSSAASHTSTGSCPTTHTHTDTQRSRHRDIIPVCV